MYRLRPGRRHPFLATIYAISLYSQALVIPAIWRSVKTQIGRTEATDYVNHTVAFAYPAIHRSLGPFISSSFPVSDDAINDSGHSLQYVGISYRQGLGYPRHPELSSRANGGNAESPKANNPLYHSQSPRGSSSNEAEKLLNSRNPPRKDEDRTKTGDNKGYLPLAKRSRGREGTLYRDSAHESDSDDDEGELAGAEPPVQPSDSQDRNSQRNIGCHRYYDTNNEEDYRLIKDSDAEHSWDNDVVQPRRRKRRRISTSILASGGTAVQQQTHYADSRSRQIQRSF
ncbi:hypothetical protein B0T26DRAFT_680963 [Lasiosphaeria miniovina]|uniref:Uncharacterized protein n=1 Tax=Lasiosphaeria miniovina TaxID=1954250 RepID=A0AA39ZT99_9PEZI|nr:uncharacterized protein B0T26DRAFT_680963 [Lasiosphaeria miniovina]KAK0703259.1 hypothetical protein B0T26DRAFT_680963 [Lasiosphaeria miniovina]